MHIYNIYNSNWHEYPLFYFHHRTAEMIHRGVDIPKTHFKKYYCMQLWLEFLLTMISHSKPKLYQLKTRKEKSIY